MKSRLSWLIISLILLAGLAGLNVLAFQYFWYWRLPWFDILMHGLGGVSIAFFINALFYHRPTFVKSYRPIAWSVAAALVVGLAWEVFEFTLGRYALIDTASDLLMAVVGAVAGGFIFNYFYCHEA